MLPEHPRQDHQTYSDRSRHQLRLGHLLSLWMLAEHLRQDHQTCSDQSRHQLRLGHLSSL